MISDPTSKNMSSNCRTTLYELLNNRLLYEAKTRLTKPVETYRHFTNLGLKPSNL